MNANEIDSNWDQAVETANTSDVDDMAVPEENDLIAANASAVPNPVAPLKPTLPEYDWSAPEPLETPSERGIKQQVSDTASQVISQVKLSAGQAIDQSKQSASQAVETAKQQVMQQLTTQKGRAADAIGNFKAPISEISQTFTNHGQPQLSSLSDSLAGQIGQVSDYLRASDFDVITRDAQAFAKQNPALVIGGAFVLGILAARFFKSSAASAVQTDPLLPLVQPQYARTGPTGNLDNFEDTAIPDRAPLTAHGYVDGGVLGGASS